MESKTVRAFTLEEGDIFIRNGTECIVREKNENGIFYTHTSYQDGYGRRKDYLRIGAKSKERILIINKNDQK